MAKKGLDLVQTRGVFQIRGIVSGVLKDSFYSEKKTKTNKDFRSLSFGLQFAKDSGMLYVSLNGMQQEKVYFSKTVDGKTDTIAVDWKDRNTFRKDGYRMIGVNVGLEKTVDEKGNEVNKKEYLAPFDACKYISEHLKDGMSVFVKGAIEYSHFIGNDGNVSRSVKLIPNQISLCKDVDFEDEKYEVVADFNQHLVFTGGRKEGDKAIIEAKIINFQTVEETEFIIEDSKLATNFKKGVSPYNSIKVWGNIRTVRNTDEVEVEDDGWGAPDPTKRVNNPYRREFVITGADPKTIDKTAYTEDAIEKALEAMKSDEKAKNDFGDDEGWGNSSKKSDKDDDSDVPW
jgi:hypothetical protein